MVPDLPLMQGRVRPQFEGLRAKGPYPLESVSNRFKLLIGTIDGDELPWDHKSHIISTVDDCSLLSLLRHRFNPMSMSSECLLGASACVRPPMMGDSSQGYLPIKADNAP